MNIEIGDLGSSKQRLYHEVRPPAFTTDGWFVGGGVETGFNFFGILPKGFFLRSEYRYASYENKTLPATEAANFGRRAISILYWLSRPPIAKSPCFSIFCG